MFLFSLCFQGRKYQTQISLRYLRHHRLRGFVSETTPNWCFDAPMLWELPQVLWNPTPLGPSAG